MPELRKFIKLWSVYSKTAGHPVAASFDNTRYVFIQGWPMTSRTYHLLSLKSVFGGGARLTPDEWENLHQETRNLCSGLCLTPRKGYEAQSIVALFRNILDISANSLQDADKITQWIALLDEKINEESDTETGA